MEVKNEDMQRVMCLKIVLKCKTLSVSIHTLPFQCCFSQDIDIRHFNSDYAALVSIKETALLFYRDDNKTRSRRLTSISIKGGKDILWRIST